MRELFILMVLLIPLVNGQCANAPTAVAQFWCAQLSTWDTSARRVTPMITSAIAAPGSPQTIASLGPQPTTPGDYLSCTSLSCACLSLGGSVSGATCNLPNGQRMVRAIRKEYRMMTGDERGRFHRAMWTIKNNGDFNTLAVIHSNVQIAAGAHGGAAFLPWHREYIKRLELLLRRVDPSVALPYWDSTLEYNLPTPADSVLFSNVLMGQTAPNGSVVTGAFRFWTQLDGQVLQRNVGAFGQPFAPADIAAVMAQTNVQGVMAYTAPQSSCPFPPDFSALEYSHGNAHAFVGGAMLVIATASADPLFWQHHAMVDFIWEQWRLARQTPAQRESQYPTDNANCETSNHFSNSIMNPFSPKVNRDGLSNMYTNQMYTYQAQPNCNLGANCGSMYLFCDRSHGAARCASKVRAGGNCQGFTQGEQVCYNGFCQNGRCVAQTATTQPTIETTSQLPGGTETCFNENECCAVWAQQNQCNINPNYMRVWCQASCRICTPRTYNLNVECNNRSPSCTWWAQNGECNNNPLWMSENCRQACNLCGRTRAQTCGGGAAVTTTTTTTTAACNSPGCYNENICCSTWTNANYCQRSPVFMSCNCRVSCGICRPDYAFGTCADYNQYCQYWQSIGECNTNPWMRENCRRSCNTCYSTSQLQGMCSTRRQSQRAGGVTKPPFKGDGHPAPPRKGRGVPKNFRGVEETINETFMQYFRMK